MSCEPVFIRCLGCSQKLRISPEKFGLAGNCPRCKTPFPAVNPGAAEPADSPPGKRRWTVWAAGLCWSWLGSVLVVAFVLHGLSEEWWINTLLLYSPRWLVLLPVVLLLPLAAYASRRSLGLLAAGVLVWLFLVTGFTVHLPVTAAANADCLRVLTCNMQGKLADGERFRALVDRTRPDVVLLQEWHGELNQQAFPDPGWTFAESGRLWAASRLPIKAARGLPAESIHLSGGAGAFEIDAPGGAVRLVNVHLPTPRDGITAVLKSRFHGLAELQSNTLARSQASSAVRQFAGVDNDGLVVAGDFNLPVESSVLHKQWGDLGNAFSRRGLGFGWTKYTRWHGARIDHILFGENWTCLHCEVGPDVGSDHRAVFAVLQTKRCGRPP